MRWIDISHVLDNQTPIYPGDYQTRLTQHKTLEKDDHNAVLLQTCLHTGTHVDLPLHLTANPRTAADFPLDGFAGKGVLLDVRGKDVIAMKAAYEDLPLENSMVLLYTGFDQFYFDERYFHDHPIVSDELAAFLVSRRIKLLGMDMAAPDRPPFSVHKALFAQGIFVLENLTNLGALIGVESFEVLALPLKIAAEASLVRAVCRTE